MVQMNLFARQKQRHRRRKQMYEHQGGKGGGGMNWEIGIDMYTPICIKWMTNKNLLYKKIKEKRKNNQRNRHKRIDKMDVMKILNFVHQKTLLTV